MRKRLAESERSQTGNAKRARRYRDRILAAINEAKTVPCVDCGGKWPPWVMDLDHVRGEKLFNVSQWRLAPKVGRKEHGSSRSGSKMLDQVMREVAKCDPVCANCHRERSWQRGQADS